MGVLDQSTRGWRDVAPMPTGRAYMGFACVGEAGGGGGCSSEGRRLMLVGGNDGVSQRLRSVSVLDLDSMRWLPADSRLWPDMAKVRNDCAASTLMSGDVLVAGGFDGGNTLSSCELFSTSDHRWRTVAPLVEARYLHTLVTLASGDVLAVGGMGGSAPLRTAEVYSPERNTWAPTAPMSVKREGHAAALLPDGRVLVSGGVGLKSAEIWNPVTGAWSPAAEMGVERGTARGVSLPSGEVAVMGGRDATHSVVDSCELYNAASNSWTTAPWKLPAAMHAFAAFVLP